MKKILLICLLSIVPAQRSQAQTETSPDTLVLRSQNELSLNVLNLLVFGALDVGYEHLLSDHTSLGIEVFAKVFNKNKGEDVDLSEVYAKEYAVTSHFKYFLKQTGTTSGLYARAFAMFSDGTNKKEIQQTQPSESGEVALEYRDLAMGLGIGGKFLTSQGYLMDLSFGLGRNLFHPDSPDIVVLPSVSVGYRF